MIRTSDDISRDNFNRKQREMFQQTIDNVNSVLKRNTPKPKPNKVWKTIKWSFLLFSILFGITILLGMIWLIKTLIVSLFI